MVKKINNTKRKLKKKVKLFLILLVVIAFIGLGITYKVLSNNENKQELKEPVRTSNEIITNILTYNIEEPVNKEFLKWINNEYSNVDFVYSAVYKT